MQGNDIFRIFAVKFQRAQEGSIAILPLLQNPQNNKGWRTKKIANNGRFQGRMETNGWI